MGKRGEGIMGVSGNEGGSEGNVLTQSVVFDTRNIEEWSGMIERKWE